MTPAVVSQAGDVVRGAFGRRPAESAEIVVSTLIAADQVQIHCQGRREFVAYGVHIFRSERQRASGLANSATVDRNTPQKLENAKIAAEKSVPSGNEIRSF